jgi:hypothetical protein
MHDDIDDIDASVARLSDLATIRQRCGQLYEWIETGDSEHFALVPTRMEAVVDYVLAVIDANYPDLNIPYHSQWRHFSVGGYDRWAELMDTLTVDPEELGRISTELTLLSVLLGAGAGTQWSYRDRDGHDYTRSEGLALASLQMYRDGLFSASSEQPLRVDAAALATLDSERLATGFQTNPGNPLVGLQGRLSLLKRLGSVITRNPGYLGGQVRLGGLFDSLKAQAEDDATLPAPELFALLLDLLAPIWPGRIDLGGFNLGDVWLHPALPGDGLIPFHQLTQWVSYSLVEPLEAADFTIIDLEQLTGLPEYRNGGLFIDLGVLRPLDAEFLQQEHAVDSDLVVEWRALTVCLLDQLAEQIRQRLEVETHQLPLVRILQGGTWAAGRKIAAECRPEGNPPINILSDGTVF